MGYWDFNNRSGQKISSSQAGLKNQLSQVVRLYVDEDLKNPKILHTKIFTKEEINLINKQNKRRKLCQK